MQHPRLQQLFQLVIIPPEWRMSKRIRVGEANRIIVKNGFVMKVQFLDVIDL